jgi:predicted ArsR family transcriptional regulator
MEPARTTERLLQRLKAAGPQTAALLADRLGVTAVAIRQHLDRLADEGLVAADDRRESVGRPKRYWQLTAAGHGRFPDNHAGLTLEIIEAAAAVFGPDGLDKLIAHREAATRDAYARRLADAPDLAAKVACLAALREAEGYMAEWSAEPDGSFLLIENHCPICAAAARCQALCRSELAVFAEALGPDARVERSEHLIAGARRCAYRITVKRP